MRAVATISVVGLIRDLHLQLDFALSSSYQATPTEVGIGLRKANVIGYIRYGGDGTSGEPRASSCIFCASSDDRPFESHQ